VPIGGLIDVIGGTIGDPATGESSLPTPVTDPAVDCAFNNGNAQSSPAEKINRFFDMTN
jgi:hypothetical protein